MESKQSSAIDKLPSGYGESFSAELGIRELQDVWEEHYPFMDAKARNRQSVNRPLGAAWAVGLGRA